MTEELENKLFEKYPKIFAGKDKPITQNLMGFGFECSDGWYWLIDRLCSSLQFRIDNPPWNKDGKVEVPQVVATQVKEKFGGLRFYVESATPEQHAVISFTEALSYYTCELCGSTKDIGHTQGWITTMCKECYENHPKKDNFKWKLNND